VSARAQHARDVGRGCDPHAGAQVAEIARVLEQDHRQRPLVGENVGRLDSWALGESDHTGGGRERSQLLEYGGFDVTGELAKARGEVGSEHPGETIQLGRVAAGDLDHVRPEAKRVLQRVKAFEHRQRAIAPRAPEARDERPVLHGPMIAGAHAELATSSSRG
jgi:hypothetical protein